MKFLQKYKVEVILFLILIGSYFILRLPNLTLQPIFADEAIYVRWAQVMKSEPTLRFLPQSDGKTPLFMWLMIPLFKFLKDPLFAGRFLSVAAGFFTMLGVFFLSKKVFNLKTAFWATLLYVITPYTVFFDRMALVDSMLSAFTIWVIYFALLLLEKERLDIAMFLGYLLGGTILTKTPGLINLLILPFAAIAFKGKKKNSFIKLVLFWTVAIGIALVMYNMLRLGPEFQKLSQRNTDYVFSPTELVGRPLDPFIPHLRDMSDWFPKLFTPSILIFVGVGVYFLLVSLNRQGLVVLVWALIPMLVSMAFLKTFTARYLLTSVSPFLIFAGFGISHLLERLRNKSMLTIPLLLMILLPMALTFDYTLITNPPPKSLPQEERRGYFEEWTAGYGLKDIAMYLIDQKKNGEVVVGTDGFFGTLPDGLYIYIDKANISVVGSSATISAKLKESSIGKQTFFVGNKNSLSVSSKDVKLIREYPKVKPIDKPADATVLYQVLPE